MDRQEIVKHIETALSEVLEREISGVAPETRLFDDLHLDSTSVLELLMSLEDTVGLEIDPEQIDINDFASVGTLTEYVSGAVGGQRRAEEHAG